MALNTMSEETDANAIDIRKKVSVYAVYPNGQTENSRFPEQIVKYPRANFHIAAVSSQERPDVEAALGFCYCSEITLRELLRKNRRGLLGKNFPGFSKNLVIPELELKRVPNCENAGHKLSAACERDRQL
jgi:hypothetical protein